MTQKEMMARRFAITPRGRLPAGYQELTYIESTGTQWIDTKTPISNDLGARVTFESTSLGVTIVGALVLDVARFQPISIASNGTYQFVPIVSNYARSYASFSEGIHTAEFNIDGAASFDNNTVYNGPFAFGSADFNIYLFARHYNGIAQPCSAKLYHVEFVKPDIPVRDFVPCRRLSDNAIGMYDLVSQSFFGNSGTGSFIAGEPV